MVFFLLLLPPFALGNVIERRVGFTNQSNLWHTDFKKDARWCTLSANMFTHMGEADVLLHFSIFFRCPDILCTKFGWEWNYFFMFQPVLVLPCIWPPVKSPIPRRANISSYAVTYVSRIDSSLSAFVFCFFGHRRWSYSGLEAEFGVADFRTAALCIISAATARQALSRTDRKIRTMFLGTFACTLEKSPLDVISAGNDLLINIMSNATWFFIFRIKFEIHSLMKTRIVASLLFCVVCQTLGLIPDRTPLSFSFSWNFTNVKIQWADPTRPSWSRQNFFKFIC